jgi:hypothetical protein
MSSVASDRVVRALRRSHHVSCHRVLPMTPEGSLGFGWKKTLMNLEKCYVNQQVQRKEELRVTRRILSGY